METKFNFKSQICTDKNQSERLLALGLKIETADCYHWQETDRYGDGNGKWHCEILSEYNKDHNEYLYNVFGVDGSDEGFFIPAWSLHRLIEMMPNGLEMQDEEGETWEYLFHLSHVEVVYDVYLYERRFSEMANIYDNLISCIEWLIKKGYFNKEYFV